MKSVFAAIVAVLLVGTPAAAESVEEIWVAKCKSCHGATGKGDTKVGQKEKVDDLTNADWHARHTDDQIRKVITEGSTKNKKMKPFKEKLTPEQIDELVGLIRGLKKP